MLLAALALTVTLAQRTESFQLSLNAPVAEATPLFGPVREREWSPEWAPRFLHPEGGAQRDGVVFTTSTHSGFEQLWLLTEYDAAAGRVAYVIVTPNFSAATITIRIVPDGAGRSKATVTYCRSALVERANDEVNSLDAAWAARQTRHWEEAINAALARARSAR
jgi:hypothetical protein